MKVDRPFKPTGKRLDNLNNLIQNKYPQDKWVLESILPIFFSIIDSSSTHGQQNQVTDILNIVFNDYEFRYNIILENMDNPKDIIKLDIPLLIRLLEYAREDAKTDMDLHNVAERLIDLSRGGVSMGMIDYEAIIGDQEKLDESFRRMQKLAGL